MDDRWWDVEQNLNSAVFHFGQAPTIAARDDFANGYVPQMAFMHAMQAAHTSLESGLLKVLDILGEVAPSGPRWHADLIARLSHGRPGVRPALLGGDMARAADRSRAFRNIAMRAYGEFQPAEAGSAIAAAELLRDGLLPALAAFMAQVDGA